MKAWLLNLSSELASEPSALSQVVIFPPGNVELAGDDPVQFTPESAAAIIADFQAQGVKMPIDYDHAIPKNAGTGKAAPACGWITKLAYDPAKGLVADVEWTNEAADHLKAGRYKYMSPTFYAGANRVVTALHSVALTNKPRIKNFPELIAASITADGTHGDDDMADKTPVTANMEALKAYMADKGMVPKESTPDQVAEYLLKYMQTNLGDGSSLCSIATRLGLDAKAESKLILASIDKLIVERVPATELKSALDRLAVIEATEKARCASIAVQETVQAGKLNPNDATLMKWASDSATKDVDGFKLWSASAPKMWEPGRETKMDGGSNPPSAQTRASVLALEAKEFMAERDKNERMGFTCASWVAAGLYQKNLPKLTEKEHAELPA